jgi:hypothetical protein
MKQIKDINAPDIEGDAGPIHYRVSRIHAGIRDLPAGNVVISLVPNSNQVRIQVNGISGSGSCRIDYKFLFISDGFDGDANIHSVGLSTTMAFGFDGEGRPTASIIQFDLGINNDNINLSFHGSIIGDLVNFLVNVLKPVFVGMVRNMINGAVPPAMNTIINNMIRSLPQSVDIGPNLAITFKIPQNPWVNADYFCVAIAGYVFYKPKPAPPPYDPKPSPDYDPASQKGIQFFLTDYVIKSAMDASFAAGLMNMLFVFPVDDYDLEMDCKANEAPAITFNNDVTVVAKAYCKITAKNKKSGEKMSFGISTDVLANLKERIKDQTLFFEIIKLVISNLKIDNPEKYDLKWFEDAINLVIAQAKDIINVLIGQRGIKLPSIEGVDYSDIEEYSKNGYIEVLVTPIIHISEKDVLKGLPTH